MPLKTKKVSAVGGGTAPAGASGGKDKPKKPYTAKGKARKTFDNTKHRCKVGYGPGVKFLYSSFDEFTADVGLPPNPNVSLDRIDPHGHYEPGNCRWATKGVQAANKKASKAGSAPSVFQVASKYRQIATATTTRHDLARLWGVSLAALNQGFLTGPTVDWLHGHQLVEGLFDFSFDLSTRPEVGGQPGVFHLPSLTAPGERVRLRGGPFWPWESAGKAQLEQPEYSGRLHGLSIAPLSQNLAPIEIDWFHQDRQPGMPGAIWVYNPAEVARSGGVEGRMLAMNSRLFHANITSFMAPLLDVLERLVDVGPWDYSSSLVLRSKVLFIPDFLLDQGAGFDLPPDSVTTLARLLRYRRELGRPTFVGVQNHNKVPERLRVDVFGHLQLRNIPFSPKFEHPSVAEVDQLSLPNVGVHKSKWDFARLKADGGFSHLFGPSVVYL